MLKSSKEIYPFLRLLVSNISYSTFILLSALNTLSKQTASSIDIFYIQRVPLLHAMDN